MADNTYSVTVTYERRVIFVIDAASEYEAKERAERTIRTGDKSAGFLSQTEPVTISVTASEPVVLAYGAQS